MYAKGILLEKKCTECEKTFFPPSTDWVYKFEVGHKTYRYQCSWKCYREATKRIAKFKKRGGGRK